MATVSAESGSAKSGIIAKASSSRFGTISDKTTCGPYAADILQEI